MPVRIKRVYDPPEEADGERVLVDRLWPRGVRQDACRRRAWLKELAPGDERRGWFGHDQSRNNAVVLKEVVEEVIQVTGYGAAPAMLSQEPTAATGRPIRLTCFLP